MITMINERYNSAVARRWLLDKFRIDIIMWCSQILTLHLTVSCYPCIERCRQAKSFFSKPLRPEKSCYLGGWKCVLDITEMLEWKNPLYSLISASSFIDTYRMAQKWHFLYVLTSYALTSSNIGRFSTYLTVRIRRTFEIILSLKILPNLKCVAIPTHIKNSNRKQRVYCLSYYLK